MIEFVKKLQKHNAELMEEIKELKEEREAILRILDSDKTATDIEKTRIITTQPKNQCS